MVRGWKGYGRKGSVQAVYFSVADEAGSGRGLTEEPLSVVKGN